jgi:glycosyltransferase involved in cell wall biosynthesis
VSHCDVVLAPYQRFVGSSGTLVWAAALQKPVLAQSYGLVGELVRRFQLGEAVDTQSPDALSGAVARLLDPSLRARYRHEMLRDQFLAGRNQHDFGDTWLRALRPHLSI